MTPLEDLAEIARQPFISEMLGASEERFTEIQQAVNAFKTLEHKTYSALKLQRVPDVAPGDPSSPSRAPEPRP